MTKVDIIDKALCTAIVFGCGVGYGAINKVDQFVAGQAFAISYLSFEIFRAAILLTAESYKLTEKTLKAVTIAGMVAWSSISIIAFRSLNLIANQGTVLISGFLALKAFQILLA